LYNKLPQNKNIHPKPAKILYPQPYAFTDAITNTIIKIMTASVIIIFFNDLLGIKKIIGFLDIYIPHL